MTKLTNEEVNRYARHLILPEVGPKGQEKLKSSSVLLIGAGGLGAPLALYLAAAGIGRIGLVDFDKVDESNLQRQVIFGTSDVGKLKVEAARQKLEDLNSFIKIETHSDPLSSENALELFKEYDVIADGTDNFPTRYLVNDACVLTGKPNVYGSIFRFEGQISVFNHEGGPCYRCLYSEPPPPGLVPSCAEGGVLGVLPGIVGSLQANEVIKVLLGIGKTASERLILFDALSLKFRELKLRKDPNCVVCGPNPTVTELIDYQVFCGINPHETKEETVSETKESTEIKEINPEKLKDMQDKKEDFILIDVREPHEYDICSIKGSKLIPLGEIEAHISSLDKQKSYVIHCKMGGRSAKAVQIMMDNGFSDVVNLEGGITKWANDIDPEMPVY